MKRLLNFLVACLLGLTMMPIALRAQDAAPVVFSQSELDKMLAPIALYPDSLLTTILIAATYPLETVQADRFVQQNSFLQGDALAAAVETQQWDPSVKSLTQFPVVLAMMDNQLTWMQQLGDAFLSQQAAVMGTVQSLRVRAQATNNLQSNRQQTVVTQNQDIDIEPYSPDVVYVPYYDPNLVFGAWWWPQPPMFWAPPPKYLPPNAVNRGRGGVVFGRGTSVTGSAFGRYRPDWSGHAVYVNDGSGNHRSTPAAAVPWTHDSAHRQGDSNRDAFTRNRIAPSYTGGNRDANGYGGRVDEGGQLQQQAQRRAVQQNLNDSPRVIQSPPERGPVNRDTQVNQPATHSVSPQTSNSALHQEPGHGSERKTQD